MRIIRVACAAIVATVLWAGTALAGPPERDEVDFFAIVADEENDLAVFVNITRDDYCAWEESEFDGPAPVGTLIPVKFKEVGPGAVVASFQSATQVSIELWQIDPDVPPFIGPCEDTDEQSAPWASGEARWMATDNDLDVSLTRMNSFGDRLTAKVVDGAGGSWHYSAIFQAQISKDDEFRAVVERSTLKPTGR